MTRLVLPEDPRAVRLFDSLDSRFIRFLDGLPPAVRSLGTTRRPYLGGPAGDPFGGVADLNPVLAATPWLFWETFEKLEDEPFLAIAEAGAHFVVASIILDHIVDGQAEPLGETALLYQALYGHGVTCFRSSFAADSPFWDHFQRLAGRHLSALSFELELQDPDARVTPADLRRTAEGKVSPIITTLAALCVSSGQTELLAPIESSLNRIALASQLLDDIGDWRHDAQVGHRTYFLSRLRGDSPKGVGDWPVVDELQSELAREWTDVDELQVVLNSLSSAAEAVQDIACAGWKVYVRGYQDLAEAHLTQAFARHLVDALRPLNPSR